MPCCFLPVCAWLHLAASCRCALLCLPVLAVPCRCLLVCLAVPGYFLLLVGAVPGCAWLCLAAFCWLGLAVCLAVPGCAWLCLAVAPSCCCA
eukprot:2907239-Karenia_brevis.AAC.1